MARMLAKWQTRIGLEVHAQIATRSKLFSDPIAKNGYLDMYEHDGVEQPKRIRLYQIQIEQDSGKTVVGYDGQTLVDLNRAGVGVLEIVTQPDITSGDEAVSFMKKIQRLLWHIGVASANMDEGSWRCDVNISVNRAGSDQYGTRTELKHISKFSSIKDAVDFEVKRQIALLESGQAVQQETRRVDDKTGETVLLRGKEEAVDYRYIPEPDLPHIFVSQKMIDGVRNSLPESLDSRWKRLRDDMKLTPYDIEVLMAEPGAVEFFEELSKGVDPKVALGWLTTNVFGWLKARNLALPDSPVRPDRLRSLIDLMGKGLLSGLRAKNVLTLMMDGDVRAPKDIALEQQWIQVNDEEQINKELDVLIAANPDLVSKQ
ncbi:hypothetical protein HK101_001124 [Irineochytrium annulatum]|nr:hypothetical protein HK101_001124 [Irineochytrium annulatum]